VAWRAVGTTAAATGTGAAAATALRAGPLGVRRSGIVNLALLVCSLGLSAFFAVEWGVLVV
jgi:hypothetical protein